MKKQLLLTAINLNENKERHDISFDNEYVNHEPTITDCSVHFNKNSIPRINESISVDKKSSIYFNSEVSSDSKVAHSSMRSYNREKEDKTSNGSNQYVLSAREIRLNFECRNQSKI